MRFFKIYHGKLQGSIRFKGLILSLANSSELIKFLQHKSLSGTF